MMLVFESAREVRRDETACTCDANLQLFRGPVGFDLEFLGDYVRLRTGRRTVRGHGGHFYLVGHV